VKLHITHGEDVLDFEGDDITESILTGVLDAFIRIADPSDETVSDTVVQNYRAAVERLEGVAAAEPVQPPDSPVQGEHDGNEV